MEGASTCVSKAEPPILVYTNVAASRLSSRLLFDWIHSCPRLVRSGRLTGSLYEHRRRCRLRHAQRARLDLFEAIAAGSAPPEPSIRCTARKKIRTTPRKVMPTTCAPWLTRPTQPFLMQSAPTRKSTDTRSKPLRSTPPDPAWSWSTEHLQPLDDYYLWCDHRAWKEAAEITAAAQANGLEAIDWCGGIYSSEWGFAKLLHWLRHNPDKRAKFATALEHCDMVAATLCGITDPGSSTQRLRHGTQMDVERVRSAACRRKSF